MLLVFFFLFDEYTAKLVNIILKQNLLLEKNCTFKLAQARLRPFIMPLLLKIEINLPTALFTEFHRVTVGTSCKILTLSLISSDTLQIKK